MGKEQWKAALKHLPLGRQYYFEQVGSTNDVAAKLLDEGAPHLSLVLADEQLEGRGRKGRKWITSRGVALAFSLILRPESGNIARNERLSLLSGLGGVAVSKALEKNYPLRVDLKWPNDVLIHGKKVAGILPESHWLGDKLCGVILGIGINVFPESVPEGVELNFPATSVIGELGEEISRPKLLANVLGELVEWYPRLESGDLLRAWEENLAFKGERVFLRGGDEAQVQGQVVGLDPDGGLQLRIESGEVKSFQVGEIRIRAVDISPK
ncbi:MAG: Bifunctional ligase/repressor BirA [Chloroflexi bacterium]|nr:Bifunctional ligase/repressor BirA [Chloroflexota bacterium]